MTRAQQIEVVAQAIRKVWNARVSLPKPREWSALPKQVRRAYREEAAAAIDAYEATRETETPPQSCQAL